MNTIDFLEKIRLVIHEASYTTVGKEWEKVVAVYPYYRIYLVKGGRAEINNKIPYRKELEAIFHIIMENRQQRNEFEKNFFKSSNAITFSFISLSKFVSFTRR